MTKPAQNSNTPDESKKASLLTVFRAAVLAESSALDMTAAAAKDAKKYETAVTKAKKDGVNDQDLEWLGDLDGKKFRTYFGAAAIDSRLESAMKRIDEFSDALGSAPDFKNKGFYK